MQRDRSFAAIGRSHQSQSAALVGLGESFLLIARRDARGAGQQPDLQKVGVAALGMVELAVPDPRARAHALNLAGQDRGDLAHAVLVRQRAVEHIADDLHVAVAVRAETGARCNPVLVDHPQVAVAHVGRVVVIGKRKAVKALEPTVVGETSVGAAAQADHDDASCSMHRWSHHQTCRPASQA